MGELVAQTCGFLPLHLYEGAELERAKNICGWINDFCMESMGVGEPSADPRHLEDLSLREMLDAVDVVEKWNSRPETSGVGFSSCMVPADRLTSAVYTLVNAQSRSTDPEDDWLMARFTKRAWGEDQVHFLVVGARAKQEIEDDEAEDEAA